MVVAFGFAIDSVQRRRTIGDDCRTSTGSVFMAGVGIPNSDNEKHYPTGAHRIAIGGANLIACGRIWRWKVAGVAVKIRYCDLGRIEPFPMHPMGLPLSSGRRPGL